MMQKINIDMDKLLDLKENGASYTKMANIFNCSTRTIQQRIAELNESDSEIIKENVKLAKQKQRFQDLNRIERKAFRDIARIDNANSELNKEIIKLLKKHELPKKIFRTKKIKTSTKSGAILQLTDLHLNELVDIVSNKYDFNIAAQRIKKFVDDAKGFLDAKKIQDVCVCMTGDLMNSDRRTDEILSQATNRSRAWVLSLIIIEQVLLDLQQCYNVSVSSVVGNESRMTKDIGWVEEVATDNYDAKLFWALKLLFRKSNIKFLNGNPLEQIIEIVGQNILILHGNQIKGSKMEQSIQKIMGKYASEKIMVSFVISGHLHSSRISDLFARGGSMVGANAYSWNALQLASRASQNIHIFYSNGNRDSIKIDLQNVDGVIGYPIIKELEAYNAKSVNKARKKVIIQRIV